jgi:hypothetical protein
MHRQILLLHFSCYFANLFCFTTRALQSNVRDFKSKRGKNTFLHHNMFTKFSHTISTLCVKWSKTFMHLLNN